MQHLPTTSASTFAFLVVSYFAIFSPFVMADKVTNPRSPPKDAILLSKVDTLTLRANRMTKHRRVKPVPQLSCVGPACQHYNVDVMRCKNDGSDYEAEDIQWSCRADLPEEFKLGGTEVGCEGYASSDDPFVLKGSCGVEYRLLLTDKGEEKFGTHNDDFQWPNEQHGGKTLASVVFFMIFAAVLFIIAKGMWQASRRNPPRLGRDNNNRPPWYGGGGDDNDDPPPPYDSPYSPPPRKGGASSSRTGMGSSSRGARQDQNQGWRPGPWTAGLGGAALGYALGRNQTQTRTQPRQTPARTGGGFFGNGSGAGPSNSPPTFSSSRHESTGFGGTSRR